MSDMLQPSSRSSASTVPPGPSEHGTAADGRLYWLLIECQKVGPGVCWRWQSQLHTACRPARDTGYRLPLSVLLISRKICSGRCGV